MLQRLMEVATQTLYCTEEDARQQKHIRGLFQLRCPDNVSDCFVVIADSLLLQLILAVGGPPVDFVHATQGKDAVSNRWMLMG